MIQGLRIAAVKAGLGVEIRNARKGEICDRIAFYNSIISQNRLRVLRGCEAVTDALKHAVYDPKHPMEDIRLDDGTSNIDSLDALEYSTEHVQDNIMYLALRR